MVKRKLSHNRLLKNISNKAFALLLSALVVFSSVFVSYDTEVHAKTFTEDVYDILQSIGSEGARTLVDLVRSGAYATGAVLGGAAGVNLGIPPEVGSVLGAWGFGSAANGVLNWYENNTVETERIHGGDERSFKAYKRTGTSTSQNTSNYNTTKNMSIYNENKTWNETTNKYDYTYNWYNPITNTYNTTNEYTYNTTYNTYNYVTHNYDITNNYNYTTNYYIQDNRTYLSYYIINVCDETKEEEETYVEMYYELPDGRNSLYLTVDDIKGQYFPSHYSKYISVAEDDGTTLGLWHLDGDLKDCSYHGNTAGIAYNNVYTDGLYTSGKQFSDSEDEFLELKLDKVDLPNSWTLEWCEFIPVVGIESEKDGHGSGLDVSGGTFNDSTVIANASSKDSTNYWFDNPDYDIFYNLDVYGFLGLNDGLLYQGVSGAFIPYCITCDNGVYKFYRNGVLQDSIDSLNFDVLRFESSSTKINVTLNGLSFSELGIFIDSNSIKFYNPVEPLVYRDENYITARSSSYSKYHTHAVYDIYFKPHANAIIDEVRLSNGVLYSGDSYTTSSQAFTTNTVLAVPKNPKKHEIAFKTNTDISDVRFGGVKPTYPANGDIYVSLDSSEKVESVQQYQEDGWYEIEASLYTGSDWVSFKDVNMEYLGIDGVIDVPDGGDDDSGGDADDDSGGSSGGGVNAILEGIGKFFDTLLTLVGKIIGMLSDFVNSVLGLFESFTVFTDGFSGFLTGAFGFLPQEAINVLISGITLIVILAIIKFLK